jgi:murein DD-endopeptidase MepM/ murein hydrolase activator NlpD
MRKRFVIAIMLLSSLIVAGCSSSSDSGSTYTVKRGDTLYAISRSTGTSVRDLARLNNISPLYHRSRAKAEAKQRFRDHGEGGGIRQEIVSETYRRRDAIFGGAAILLAAGRATLLALANQR